MSEKKVNSTKKYKITRQYKYLSNEFNPVCIKARYNLKHINLFLKEKENNDKSDQKSSDLEEDKNNSDEEKNRKIKGNSKEFDNSKKIKPFVCPSDKEIKKLIYYQRLEKYKISKEKGFQNYIKKMIPNSQEVQNFQKRINNNASLNYDFYIIPKIENKKKVLTKKRSYSVSFSS